MFTDKLKSRKLSIAKEIAELERRIKTYPKGSFFTVKNGKYHKWFTTINGKTHYIPKRNRTFAEKLATRKYCDCKLKDLMCEMKAIEAYLEYDSLFHLNEERFLDDPSNLELVKNSFQVQSELLKSWQDEEFNTNPAMPEQLIHPSVSGHILRSKSEVYIDSELFKCGIPFRYEAELEVGGHIFYPDFTIRHPVTGDIYYWEHCGRMDDPEYVARFMRKLQIYISNGIIPQVNLILTFETLAHPFSMTMVSAIISYYFN